jgi:processive 1,2-diacylglycerol beta-glucosyltransferase
MKKILILYTSVGLGHKTIAENIGYALEHAGYQVLLHDILKVQAGRLVNFGTSIHAFINRRLPWLWRFIYFYGHYVLYPFRIAIASKNYGQLKKVVDHFGPDMIISTQTTSSAVVAYMKRKGFFKGLFGIGFSDYHFHPYWVYKEADFYLANIEEQKQEMVRRGIPENRIFVCGMTLQPKTQVDIVSVKQRLGILPEEKVVLMASGSLGIGPSSADWLRLVAKLKQQALQQGLKLKLCIITGKNQEFHLDFFEALDPFF